MPTGMANTIMESADSTMSNSLFKVAGFVFFYRVIGCGGIWRRGGGGVEGGTIDHDTGEGGHGACCLTISTVA